MKHDLYFFGSANKLTKSSMSVVKAFVIESCSYKFVELVLDVIFNETEFVEGQGVPVFVPGVGDEGVVVRFKVIGWNFKKNR